MNKSIVPILLVIIILNILIYINSEYIFKILVYNLSPNMYNASLINLGYSPLNYKSKDFLKYSHELYSKIINVSKPYLGDLTKLHIVEIPCVNANSGHYLINNFNIKKITCITNNKLIHNINNTLDKKKFKYIYGDYKNLAKYNIKNIDVILSIELQKNNYNFFNMINVVKNILNPNKHWIICDIFNKKKFSMIFKKLQNNFTIKYKLDITHNIIDSITFDSGRKESFITSVPIIKEYMTNFLVTKNSKLYYDLKNGKLIYMIFILSK